MRALVFHRPRHVSCDTIADPCILQPTDAIVRVTSTAICGSDLHIYRGLFPQLASLVMGHELTGVVEEVGREVTKLRRGDRLVVPFPIACGTCWFCEHRLPDHCRRSQLVHDADAGLLTQRGGGLFGTVDPLGGFSGGQAELVRVPFVEHGPRKVPDGLDDDDVLFLADTLSAGFGAIAWAELRGGDTVAVFGCGAVGIMAQKSAWARGAGRVIAIDRAPARLAKARDCAQSETIDAARHDPSDAVLAMTGGRGADLVVDAIGMEAHQSVLKKMTSATHLQIGSTAGLEACLRAVRPGGAVSVVAAHGGLFGALDLGRVIDKRVRMSFGHAPAHEHIDELMRLIADGRIRARDVASHHVRLEDGARAYQICDERTEGFAKVVLRP